MDQSTIQLSVIIVNYNVKYFLEQALLAVQNASYRLTVEVFVVDNNSVDESVSMVQQKFPNVRLIVNEENTGFSVANNQAIREARGKYILLLNPDTVVNEDTFDQCFQFMECHPEAGALGVKMIDGSGKYLPESKRGFPSPFVAFCKTFGLGRLFPNSPVFNRYYMGHLSADETNEIDILAGAFMWMRKLVLDEVGLLDEQFFMYGEDIDLSYRIIKAGYKNYYLATTSIIHYKGESTKKGSLNYVRTFYNAMILFAQKHFTGRKARLFILMLKAAIYFRASLTLFSNTVKKLYLPFLDGTGIFLGLLLLKNFWEQYHFDNPDYYPTWVNYVNFPLYTVVWLIGIYFSGNYDRTGDLRRLVKGILVGSLVIAAIYGFLPVAYRNSRALIVLGTTWALAFTTLLRTGLHFLRNKNFKVGKSQLKRLVIVGAIAESERVQTLLNQAQVDFNLIGTVAPITRPSTGQYISGIDRLKEVVQIYEIEEIIFCSKDITANAIMEWMATLGAAIEYKIVPQESLSIIGSSSKNTAGELYTIDIKFNINESLQARNKVLFDKLFCLFLLCGLPLNLLIVKNRLGLLSNIFSVLKGQKTWVGYAPLHSQTQKLPSLKPAVLSIATPFAKLQLSQKTKERLNFLYAKDYTTAKDMEMVWKNYRSLGN